MVNGFKCVQKVFVINALFNQKPVKLLHNGSDVVDRGGPSDNTSSKALDKFNFMEM